MTDDDQQVSALRAQLDHELGSVRATEQARERLHRRLAEPSRRPQPRLRPRRMTSFAVPLAAAAVVAVAVVAVSAVRGADLLPDPNRSASTPAGQPAQPVPAASTPPTVAPADPTPTARPTPTEDRSLTAEPTAKTSAAAAPTVSVRPTAGRVGQPVALTVGLVAREYGDIDVSWGDGSSKTIASGSCSMAARKSLAASPTAVSPTATLPTAASPALASPVATSPATGPSGSHVYRQAGRYRVVVTVDACGRREIARVTVTVGRGQATPS